MRKKIFSIWTKLVVSGGHFLVMALVKCHGEKKSKQRFMIAFFSNGAKEKPIIVT